MLNARNMRERLIRGGISQQDQIRGCNEEEVAKLERDFSVELPSAYKEFLYNFGRSAGGFWRDIDYSFDRLPWINREMREILEELESVTLKLPNHAFVFSARRGEQFLFFIADGKNQNPTIYHYMIGYFEFKGSDGTFWDTIEAELTICENAYRKVPRGRFPWMN